MAKFVYKMQNILDIKMRLETHHFEIALDKAEPGSKDSTKYN